MRRSIFKAGAWTVLGLAIAFAVVSANSGTRRAVTTAAPAAKSTVATAASSHDDCSSTSTCCARETKVTKAAVAAAPKQASKPAARPTGVAGLVTAIDPETGQLGMPSAQQMAELEAQITPSDDLNRSDAGLELVRHPDGSLSVNLQGRFQEFSTVQILPNGKKAFGCTSDPRNLTQPTPTSAPSGLEEK